MTPKLQVKLGGRVHTIVCGAAPLNPEVRGFVREMFGCYFIEGYGQTENAAAGCGTLFANYCEEDGCIGVPTPWTGIKLVDVPDMNYFAKDGQGEICFRGGNIMKGYFKMPEKTKETLGRVYNLNYNNIFTLIRFLRSFKFLNKSSIFIQNCDF